MELTYTERNGVMYPDLALPEQTNYPIGKYGKMRLDYLKKHRRGTYTTLCEANTGSHLPLEDRQARLSGAERANLRAMREYPVTPCGVPFLCAVARMRTSTAAQIMETKQTAMRWERMPFLLCKMMPFRHQGIL